MKTIGQCWFCHVLWLVVPVRVSASVLERLPYRFATLLLRDGTVKMKVIHGVCSSPLDSRLFIAMMKTTSHNKERCK